MGVIIGAPIAFTVAILVVGFFLWKALQIYNKKKIEDLEGRLEFKDERISSLEYRVEHEVGELKERLAAEGDTIVKVRSLLEERDKQIQTLKKELTSNTPSLLLSTNEILYPPEGGVLWRLSQKFSADGPFSVDGPFCPRHKSRLFYRDHYANTDRIEDFDKHFLSGSGWFVCPLNKAEEFIFVNLGAITVGQLRVRATERLKVKLESELVSSS